MILGRWRGWSGGNEGLKKELLRGCSRCFLGRLAMSFENKPESNVGISLAMLIL
jgi:hypothetical protein